MEDENEKLIQFADFVGREKQKIFDDEVEHYVSYHEFLMSEIRDKVRVTEQALDDGDIFTYIEKATNKKVIVITTTFFINDNKPRVVVVAERIWEMELAYKDGR